MRYGLYSIFKLQLVKIIFILISRVNMVMLVIVISLVVSIFMLLLLTTISKKFNNYTYNEYKFEFFSYQQFCLVTLFYSFVLFGLYWYKIEESILGDVLNGIILVSLGAIGFIFTMSYNFKKTNFRIGLLGSLLQFITYLPFSCFIIYGFAILYEFIFKL